MMIYGLKGQVDSVELMDLMQMKDDQKKLRLVQAQLWLMWVLYKNGSNLSIPLIFIELWIFNEFLKFSRQYIQPIHGHWLRMQHRNVPIISEQG